MSIVKSFQTFISLNINNLEFKLKIKCQKIRQLKKYFHIKLFDISKLLSLQIRNITPNLSE